MPTLAERAAAMLAARMKQTRGRSVVYSRPAAGLSVPLTAWPGRGGASSEDERPPRVAWSQLDWLFSAADLVAAGVTMPPAKGDRITDPATGETFELFAESGGQHWHWSDADTRTTVRAHTRRAAGV